MLDFHTLTLQSPIQTPKSEAPELKVFVSSLAISAKQARPRFTTMLDPGFPRGGGANSVPGEGIQTRDFTNFLRKLHEVERIWMPGGGGRGAPNRSANRVFRLEPHSVRSGNIV